MKGARLIKKEPFINENTKSGFFKFKRSQLCIPYAPLPPYQDKLPASRPQAIRNCLPIKSFS